MNKLKTILKILSIALLTTCISTPALHAQIKLNVDTIECHIIGFSVSPMMADGLFSYSKDANGVNTPEKTMHGLYKGPFLNFGVSDFYKLKTNWLVSLEGDLWFGDDNLKNRIERMPGVYTPTGIVIGENGVDGMYTCNNRGLSLKLGMGKVFPVSPKNPNSGIMARMAAGWGMSKTVFSQDIHQSPCYQLAGNYRNLYDHRRGGFMLTEGLGYWYMSNNRDMVNFQVALEVSQLWSVSTRKYVIDDLVGLRGPDNDKHFDMIYTLKLCWMIPLKGKTVYDFYYY